MLFITGIGTEVGKTIASAVVVEALEADYWKPVQSGYPEDSDKRTVQTLISNANSQFWPEAYALKAPLSPHAAAELESVQVEVEQIKIPQTTNILVAEGAGGLHVPLNNDVLYIDVLEQWKPTTLLVSRNYLGSINHTLLSIEALKARNIPILGILFIGDSTPATEQIIEKMAQVPIVGRIPMLKPLDKTNIKMAADTIKAKLKKLLKK